MRVKNVIIFLILSLSIFITIWGILKMERHKNQIIKVNITLKNNCELIDSAFMVSSYPEEKNAYFENKRAVMYLKRSSKVQLRANNKYEGFHFSSIPVKVEKDLILEANCSDEGRLEDIFNSLKEQFKD
tara:strand:- start:29 stop:415 length:387 start_codon:yes stop_codon:yes gene_type:complete